MATAELTRLGWHIKQESLETFEAEEKGSKDAILKRALNTDLRDIGASWLDEDINRSKLDYVVGPAVLQLQKVRVVSAPKENEESQTAPKLCRLSLTDGHITCSAITLEPIKGIGTSTAPGTKVLLSGTIEVESSFLLLTCNNFQSLGGRVESLYEPWELKKTLAKQSLTRARGEGGPPPFVPFGKKIGKNPPPSLQKDNFKSLSVPKDKKSSENDSEFEQQRQAGIKQALQTKSTSGGVKTFGGGNKAQINDRDVARITDMGFAAEEATSALRNSAGNVEEAIHLLLSGGMRYQRGGERGGGRGLSRGGGEGGRRGRRERDRDNDDDGDGPINTRPSGPATLFDFLETKIPSKDGKKAASSNSKSVQPTTNVSASYSNTPQDKLYSEPSRSKPQYQQQKPDQESSYQRKPHYQSQKSDQDLSERCSYRDGLHKEQNSGKRAVSNSFQNQTEKPSQESSSQRCAYRDGISKDNYNSDRGSSGFDGKQNKFDTGRDGRVFGQQQSDIPPRFARSGQQSRGGGHYNRDGMDSGHQEGYNKGTGRYAKEEHRGGGRRDGKYNRAENQDTQNGRYGSAGEQGRHNGGPGGYNSGKGNSYSANNAYSNPKPGAYPSPQQRPPLLDKPQHPDNFNTVQDETSSSARPKSSPHASDENRNNRGRFQAESNSHENNSVRGSQGDHQSNNKHVGDFSDRRRSYPDHNSGADGYARQEPVESSNRNSSQKFGGRDSQQYPDNRGGTQPPRFNKRPENSDNGRHNNQNQEGKPFPNPYQNNAYHRHQMPSYDSSGVSIGDTVLAKYWEDGEFYPAVVENVHQAGSTVVVTFIEYGNQEEVLTVDLMPFQQHGWPYQMPPQMFAGAGGGPNPSRQDPGFPGGPGFVPPMEFTRGGGNYQGPNGGGGGGNHRRRPDFDRRKPTQKYYVAPNQAPH